jgi:hypothetical protein
MDITAGENRPPMMGIGRPMVVTERAPRPVILPARPSIAAVAPLRTPRPGCAVEDPDNNAPRAPTARSRRDADADAARGDVRGLATPTRATDAPSAVAADMRDACEDAYVPTGYPTWRGTKNLKNCC